MPEPDFRSVFRDFAARVGLAAPASDLSGVRARARRRRTSAWAIAAAAVMVLVAPVGVYAFAGRTPSPAGQETDTAGTTSLGGSNHVGAIGAAPRAGARPPRAPAGPTPHASSTPTPVPSASSSVSPSSAPVAATSPVTAAIKNTDWADAILEIPANQTGCAAGTAHFQKAVASVAGTTYHLGSGRLDKIEVAYGDVDADGQDEALLTVSCTTPPGRENPPSLVLLVSAVPAVHTMALGFSTSPRLGDGEGKSSIMGLAIHSDGEITFDVRTFEGNGECQYRARWTDTALTGACEP